MRLHTAMKTAAVLAVTARLAAGCGSDGGSIRGLARLLRRNPTDAERLLWKALTTDRRFAGQFKRQTPVGRQIPDFISFIHRLAIELVGGERMFRSRCHAEALPQMAGDPQVLRLDRQPKHPDVEASVQKRLLLVRGGRL